METIKLKSIYYYIADDVKKKYPKIFARCKKPRNIIHIRKIKETNYCYAYNKDKKWILSDDKYPRAKLLLNKKYIDESVKTVDKKFKTKLEEPSDDSSNNESSDNESSGDEESSENKFSDDESSDNESSDNDESSDCDSDDEKNNTNKAPPILLLEDNEKFTDSDDYILNIEVRGTRDHNNCYFKLSDVSKEFDIPQLNTIILKSNAYKRNIDYKCFTESTGHDKSIFSKRLYLTYKGLTHVLFASHSKSAHKFQDWATKKLFILQLGTEEQKIGLCSKTLGVSTDVIKSFFNSSILKLPCVYLFSIGLVKDLRKSMNIPKEYDDYDIVMKFGRTDDLPRRTYEHNRDYGEIKGSDLHLKYFIYVNVACTSKAETNIKKYFETSKFDFKYKDHKELIICNKNSLNKDIKEKYAEIGNMYGSDVIILNKTIECLEIQNESVKKENEYIKKENDFIKKSYEDKMSILELKHENKMLKLKNK